MYFVSGFRTLAEQLPDGEEASLCANVSQISAVEPAKKYSSDDSGEKNSDYIRNFYYGIILMPSGLLSTNPSESFTTASKSISPCCKKIDIVWSFCCHDIKPNNKAQRKQILS